jgi:hypothetical protein
VASGRGEVKQKARCPLAKGIRRSAYERQRLIAFAVAQVQEEKTMVQAQKVASTGDKAELKSFQKPDEVREFPKGRLELVKIGGATIGRAIFEPGWRWATSVQPIAKTKSCEAPHFQYHVAGVLRIKMDDGSEFDCKPGDVSLLPSGHDAWVVGSEPAIVVDFQGMLDYASDQHAAWDSIAASAMASPSLRHR